MTCLSVVEHGVDLEPYFAEMARITRPGGILITSTDYFDTPTDTRGQHAFGVPVHVFTRHEIEAALEMAARHGFSLVAPLDLCCDQRVVHWEQLDLHYTFVVFALRKTED